VKNVWFNNSYIKSVPWQQNHSSCDQSSSDVRMRWRCCHRRWIDRSIDDQGCIHFWPASRVVHASQTIDGSSTCAGSPPIIVWRRPDGTKFLWIYARIQLGGAPWSTSTGAHLASDRSVAELMKNSRAWFVRGLARPLGWVLEELDQGFMVYAWAYNSMLWMTEIGMPYCCIASIINDSVLNTAMHALAVASVNLGWLAQCPTIIFLFVWPHI
jgi:hypothetical protein